MIIDTDDYIGVAETCDILGVRKARVSQLCNKGKFDGAFQIGRTWLIPKVSVEFYERGKPGRPSSHED